MRFTSKFLFVFLVTFVLHFQARTNLAFASPPVAVAPNLYDVGIPSSYINTWARPQDLGRQRESNWCWAASIQIVLNLAQIPITQEQVVMKAFHGNLVNFPGTRQQILGALNGMLYNYKNKPVIISSFVEPSYFQILSDLSYNYPVILDLGSIQSIGHSVVITGARYRIINGRPQILYFLIRDPWPLNSSLQKFSSQYFPNIREAIGVRVFYPQGT